MGSISKYTPSKPLKYGGLNIYNQNERTVFNNPKSSCSVSYPSNKVKLGANSSEIEIKGKGGSLVQFPQNVVINEYYKVSKQEECVFGLTEFNNYRESGQGNGIRGELN